MASRPVEREIQLLGHVLDIPPDEIPDDYWSFCKNVEFRDQATRRIGGVGLWFGRERNSWYPAFIYPIQRRATAQWLIVYFDLPLTQRITIYDGSTPTGNILESVIDRDPFDYKWTATDHNGVIILNDGVSTPRYWDEVGNQLLDLPGWPAGLSCRSIRSFKNHLFALGLSDLGGERGYEYIWSDASEPGTIPTTWEAGPDNNAGSNQIPHPQGNLVDAIPLRDTLLLMKEFSSHQVYFVRGAQVFAQRDQFLNVGVLEVDCAVSLGDRALIASQDDIIETDGASYRSICHWQIRRAIFESLNKQTRYCRMVKRHLYDEIWFLYPTKDAETYTSGTPVTSVWCDMGAVFNAKTGRWGMRDFERPVACAAYGLINDPEAETTWDSRTTMWDADPTRWNEQFYSPTADQLLLGHIVDTGPAAFGLVGVVDKGDFFFDLQDVQIEAEARREGIRLDERNDTVKLVVEVWPHLLGERGTVVDVQVGGAMSEDDPVVWCPAVPYEIGAAQKKIDVFCAGRLHAFRFRSIGGKRWRMYDFKVRYVVEGRF